jgi:hypothetical protein
MDFYFNTNMDSTYVGKYSTLMCFHSKGPSHFCNPFLPYILIPIKNNELKVLYFKPLQF